MDQQIANYKNIINLSDVYLTKKTDSRYIQDLISIERLLDRSRVVIAELAVTDEEKEKSRMFITEVNSYLDISIRPGIDEKIKSLSPEEKGFLVDSIEHTYLTTKHMILL